MFVASLAIALIVSASLPTDPAALVTELGSPRYHQREAAADALVQLGSRGVEALRQARDHRDPEIRARAATILTRIEQDLLTQSTMVTLDYRNVRLVDAIQTLQQRSGLDLVLRPDEDPSWADARLDLHQSVPIPFWKALDRLCETAKAHPIWEDVGRPGRTETSIGLAPGILHQPLPVSDSGPFRVYLTSLHSQSDLTLGNLSTGSSPRLASAKEGSPPESSRPHRQFYAQLLVVAEPRLTLAQAGSVRVTQALDERGRSLHLPGSPVPVHRAAGYAGLSVAPSLTIRVDLAQPDPGVEHLRLLRGSIPVQVSARKPSPATLELAQAAGRHFQDDGTSYSILQVTSDRPANSTAIDLELRPQEQSRTEGVVIPPGNSRREVNPRQVEILDQSGNIMPWFESRASYDGEVTRATLSVSGHGDRQPTSIRFHEINQTRTEFPFEFRSIALP